MLTQKGTIFPFETQPVKNSPQTGLRVGGRAPTPAPKLPFSIDLDSRLERDDESKAQDLIELGFDCLEMVVADFFPRFLY